MENVASRVREDASIFSSLMSKAMTDRCKASAIASRGAREERDIGCDIVRFDPLLKFGGGGGGYVLCGFLLINVITDV
jgi:hypothetical protein